jgi:uncharacterized membrane protein
VSALPRLILMLASVLLMVVSIPLMLNQVPRNRWYGLRTPKTMTGAEDQWYRPNREAGIVLFLAGLVSTLAWLVIPYIARHSGYATGLCVGIMFLTVTGASVVEIGRHWK